VDKGGKVKQTQTGWTKQWRSSWRLSLESRWKTEFRQSSGKSNDDAAIEFDSVTKVYRRGLGGQRIPALTHVSFTVNRARFARFLDRMAPEKTTSISILMGFHAADSGQARVLGFEPGDVRRKNRLDLCRRILRFISI